MPEIGFKKKCFYMDKAIKKEMNNSQAFLDQPNFFASSVMLLPRKNTTKFCQGDRSILNFSWASCKLYFLWDITWFISIQDSFIKINIPIEKEFRLSMSVKN